MLDPVAAGLPPCLCADAATTSLVERSADLVLGHSLIVAVPHFVSALLLCTCTKFLSACHLTKYEALLLSSPHISLQCCPTLNPAFLLPVPSNGEPHDCKCLCSLLSKPRHDLSDTPLHNPDLVLFTDSSCFRSPDGTLVTGFAVCSTFEPLLHAPLPGVHTAQIAELVALTKAFTLVSGQSATVYTDSRCAFGVMYDFGQLWQIRGFLIAQGTPIKMASMLRTS